MYKCPTCDVYLRIKGDDSAEYFEGIISTYECPKCNEDYHLEDNYEKYTRILKDKTERHIYKNGY